MPLISYILVAVSVGYVIVAAATRLTTQRRRSAGVALNLERIEQVDRESNPLHQATIQARAGSSAVFTVTVTSEHAEAVVRDLALKIAQGQPQEIDLRDKHVDLDLTDAEPFDLTESAVQESA